MTETAEKKTLREEAKERTLNLIIAALGFVAGLAWNDAIKALIESFFPIGTDTLAARFAYAIVVTLAVVIVTVNLIRWLQKKK